MMLATLKKRCRRFSVYLPLSLRTFTPLWTGLLFSGLLLTGCATDLHQQTHQPVLKLPEKQLADFLVIRCENIWQLQGEQSDSNPLYWLRGMECAKRLTEAQARQQAGEWLADSWQQQFKQAILLANVKISAEARQKLLSQLDARQHAIPTAVLPLFQLWRALQHTQLALAQERSHLHKLQQTTDSELDSLRQQLQSSRHQLSETTKKLESLTDIERQLSTRKAAEGDISPGNHMPDKANPPAKKPPPSAKDTAP